MASTRFKRIIQEAGESGAAAMQQVMTNVMTEVAKKLIFGG